MEPTNMGRLMFEIIILCFYASSFFPFTVIGLTSSVSKIRIRN